LCGKSTAKRVDHIRQQATEAGRRLSLGYGRSVCVVLSEFYGPDILQEVGYKTTSPRGKHSRKRRRRQDNKGATGNDEGEEETEWQGLKQFLDPNPQLKGTSQQDNELQIPSPHFDKTSQLPSTKIHTIHLLQIYCRSSLVKCDY